MDARDSTRRAGPSAQEPLPVADTKLAPPRLRDGTLARPRVLALLDATAETSVTIVTAPAGYGKTTAVRAWCASRDTALAWVTLDDGDNDPARLWTYVASAVNNIRDGLARTALQGLRSSAMSVETAIDEIFAGVARDGSPITLVLDDFQTVTAAECLRTVEYAFGTVPPNARLFLLSRTDPRLRLARLRAAGAVSELRGPELAFTFEEAHQLLVGRDRLALHPETVKALNDRAEGWPAALSLASLWLQTVRDPGRAAIEFSGRHRLVVDLLAEEVIASLNAEERAFVLPVATLAHVTPALCDGILRRSDSARLLNDLERRNLLIAPLEHGGWYHVHSLLSEYAAARLEADEQGAAARIRRAAAAWLRDQGLVVEAIGQALAAGDDELVAALLLEHHLVLIRSGAEGTLLLRARRLADEALAKRPVLAAAAATASLLLGRPIHERLRLLDLAERGSSGAAADAYLAAAIDMIRCHSLLDGVADAVERGQRAVQRSAADADELSVGALAGLAHAQVLAGEIDEAARVAVGALKHPQAEARPQSTSLARSALAFVAVERDDLAGGHDHAARALAEPGSSRRRTGLPGAMGALALGAVLLAEGKAAEAKRELTAAERFFRDEIPTLAHARTELLLARASCRRGRLDDAVHSLRTARDAITASPDPGVLRRLSDEVGAEIATAGQQAREDAFERPSPAELAVLRLLAADLTTREVGARLYLSPNTVRTHTRSLHRKLQASSRVDLTARAVALGLIDADHSSLG